MKEKRNCGGNVTNSPRSICKKSYFPFWGSLRGVEQVDSAKVKGREYSCVLVVRVMNAFNDFTETV